MEVRGTPHREPVDRERLMTAIATIQGGVGAVEHLEVFPEVGSTNEVALEDGREALLVVAGQQSHGRGRHGSSWSSPEGGLYVTFVPPAHLLPHRLQDIPLVTALAVADGIDLELARAWGGGAGPRSRLKWPNDVLLGEGKVAGILVQSTSSSRRPGTQVLIGIGVNVNADVPIPDITTSWNEDGDGMPIRPVSIRSVTGRPVELETLLVGAMASIVSRLPRGLDTAALSEYISRCETLSRNISFLRDGGRGRGIAKAIAEDGSLVVEIEGGVSVHLASGEVRHLRELPPG